MELINGSVAGNNTPWIIQGYFNVALSMHEHSRAMASRSDHNAIQNFQNIVQNCDMMDLASVGPAFSWMKCQDDNPISKKLDRVMVNTFWINGFPHSYTMFES